MKKLLFFLTIILISCSAWGAKISGGTKLYLTPNSSWNQSNARFAAYFFGDGEAWVSMTKVTGETNLYEVTSPSGKNFTNVIFCRMNPSASANNWNNKWNQTADLTYDGTKNHYTVKEGTWDKGGGTWEIYTPPTVSFKNLQDTYYVGDTYTLEVTHEGLGTSITIEYKVNYDGNETLISDKKYTFEKAGNYTFTVTVKGNSKTATDTKKVTVLENKYVTFENLKETYIIGETYTFASTSSGLTNPTCTYFVDGKEINEKTYTFLEVKDYTLKVTAEAKEGTVSKEKTVNVPEPVVTFTKPTETYIIGDRFTLTPAKATQILKPTYTYKVNNEEIDPIKGYIFKNTGDFIFSVEVKYNGEGNVLASGNYTITIEKMAPIYFKPNNDWKQDNARFAVYYWNEKGNYNWASLENISNEDIYAAYIPEGQTGIIFGRMTPSNPANNWDNKWNQTGDLKYNGTNNFYTLSTNKEGGDTWNNFTGSWSTYTPSKLYISGDFENEIEVKDGVASTTQTGAFPAGTYDVVVNDGTRYWQNATSITIEETVPTIDFSVDATTKEITVTPKNTFAEPSNLIIDTEYGNLSYQLTMQEDRWYWISLPFNVNVEDIVTTGANKNYNDLVFTEYNAQARADGGNGWINWKTAGKDIAAETLIANKGYVIGPKTKSGETYKAITVTFPSASDANTVTDTDTLSTEPTKGNKPQDANWHIIGTGLYHPTTKLGNINYIAVPDTNSASYYKYFYVREASGFFQTPLNHTFKPFEAFFVQYGGTYSATAESTKSAAELAPMARAKAQEQEQIYLINMNEARTVVILNAEGSEGYTAGEDFLEMNLGSRIEMIYSFDGTDALAFNHRAPEAQSINLGGYVATAGEQTISLNGYNTNVESVTLIDNTTGTTTDLLAGNYTFNAEVGSLDGRFTVVFGAQKAGGITTDCYNSTANQIIAYGSANACTVSGLTAGEAIVVYNTMGQLVFATIADSETITLPSLTTGNYLILHNGTTNKVALR